jgi:hypothetical protein
MDSFFLFYREKRQSKRIMGCGLLQKMPGGTDKGMAEKVIHIPGQVSSRTMYICLLWWSRIAPGRSFSLEREHHRWRAWQSQPQGTRARVVQSNGRFPGGCMALSPAIQESQGHTGRDTLLDNQGKPFLHHPHAYAEPKKLKKARGAAQPDTCAFETDRTITRYPVALCEERNMSAHRRQSRQPRCDDPAIPALPL